MEKMKKATNQDKFKALRLAEIQLTDQEDYKNCVNDMTKTAYLNKAEATVVANAIRSKYLPNVLRENAQINQITLHLISHLSNLGVIVIGY